MNMSWLTVRDLEYIVAVSQTLHFGKAALACHVSQPALSAQIKKTEALLGLTLFERTNRRVAVSARGKEVLIQARVILEEVRRLGDLSAAKVDPMSGTFRLGCIATLGPYLLPHLLPHIRKAFPRANFLLREGLTSELIGELKEGELDMVVCASTLRDETLTIAPLFFEPFLLAVPREHELATKSFLTTRDLKPDEMVLLEDGHCLKDQTLELCSRVKGRVSQSFQATSVETLRHLVASGSGYTLLPWLAVKADRNLGRLVRYRELDRPVGRDVVLVYRRKFGRVADVEEFIRFVKKNLPDGLESAR